MHVVYLNICSLLSRTTYKLASTDQLTPHQDALPLIWFENIWGYFEVNDATVLPISPEVNRVVWRASCITCALTVFRICRLTQWRPSL